MSEENNNNNNDREDSVLIQILKVFGILIAGAVLLVVLGFGLLVGFCALSSRH